MLALCALAQQNGYVLTPAMTGLEYGATNSFYVDASYASSLALQVGFTGAGARTTVAELGLTNNPAEDDALGIELDGAWTVYTWKDAPVTTATNYSGWGTNLVITFTNGATEGDTLTIIFNGIERAFYFTNNLDNPLYVMTNSVATNAAKNFYAIASSYWPPPQMSIAENDGIVTIKSGAGGGAGGAWGDITDAAGVTTNTQTSYSTVTTVTATNLYQVATAASVEEATTNLYAKLAADYSSSLLPAYASASTITLTTIYAPGLALTNGAWATNVVTTNDITGNVIFKAYNSLDQQTWFADSAKDFSLAYSGTAAVTMLTNWDSLGAVGYWKWDVENAAGNYAYPFNLKVQSAVKRGL